MELLLDTHAYLWWMDDSKRLKARARRAIADSTSLVYVSAASIWEIAIKSRLGRIEVHGDTVDQIEENDFLPLNITPAHARRAGGLPEHHKDPFDRMLIAQAQIEALLVVTHDDVFCAYDVTLLRT